MGETKRVDRRDVHRKSRIAMGEDPAHLCVGLATVTVATILFGQHTGRKPLLRTDLPDIRRERVLLPFTGAGGDILVYNISFERGKLTDLALSFPKYKAAINRIIARLKDLMIPFQQRWYYTPSMQGSYSIKKVLPALVPVMSYSNLNIQEGTTASGVLRRW